MPRFKELFPEYEKHQVIGGMGALVVKDDVGRYAEKAGPRENPVDAYTMAGIIRDAGLTVEEFKNVKRAL